MVNQDLRTALVAAFPPAPITHDTIHSPDARWMSYDARDQLSLVEDVAWPDLAPEVLEQHPELLVHAGGALFRAILPAYLLYLLTLADNEDGYRTVLPYAVANQLARTDSAIDREIFVERTGSMTTDQREVIHRIIAMLASQPLRESLREALSTSLRAW